MVGRICPPPPPGWDRVKESENLGATAVAPVAPADTSLKSSYGPSISHTANTSAVKITVFPCVPFPAVFSLYFLH